MRFLKELLQEEEKKKKKKKGDKSADKFTTYVSGNMLFKNACSGDLSGTKETETDTGI